MAKKSRIYSVIVRTARDGEFRYQKPVPGMSKKHVSAEMNSSSMAVLRVDYVGWYDIDLMGDSSGEYYFELTSKKNQYVYTFENYDYGWSHLNLQFQNNVDDMIEEIEKANGYYDY
ncbi:hypothetical protein [Providencia heimbachae]|nr:hypothetical protein [Providencia heimbachae]SQH13250.1 Uncharacterised protein [Providencia heimbachae]